jgi:hypothetical protein
VVGVVSLSGGVDCNGGGIGIAGEKFLNLHLPFLGKYTWKYCFFLFLRSFSKVLYFLIARVAAADAVAAYVHVDEQRSRLRVKENTFLVQT